MPERNLHRSIRIVLVRLPNGWCAHDEKDSGFERDKQFAFESTESLQRQLVRLVGKSGWAINMPPRDARGHFLPAKEHQP